MANVIDLIRNMSKKHKARIENSKKIAEKMIKTAQAASAEGRKK